MSEYGLKIKNYEAGSVYAVNCGCRMTYDSHDAMLANSMFSKFMQDNGLDVWKETSTRDIICMQFDYGTKSYDEEIKSLTKRIKEANSPGKYNSEKEAAEAIAKLQGLKDIAENNKDKFDKKSRNEIREIYYRDGVNIKYPVYKITGRGKKPEVVDYDVIHYKMLVRSAGKAKKGECMFIREELYDVAHDFLWMGLELQEEDPDLVGIGAYSSLMTSSTIATLPIKKEQMLIIPDVDSHVISNIISVELDEFGHCVAVPKENYRAKNTMFDGQALIDISLFPSWGEGYVLLRQHFCKMAAFCSNIELFFRDRFGDEYETATIKDYWGNDHFVKDIKFITTENAMKWMKYDCTYDEWWERVHKCDDLFGIVKTAHESKFGDVQRMSYQMINALDLDTMSETMDKTIEYINLLNSDLDVFLDYLRQNTNFSNDYDALLALQEHNPLFYRSEYFKERRRTIVTGYIQNVKMGKAIQNADNLVIVGSPYAMLLAAAGDDVEQDITFEYEEDAIQCYTERFEDGEYLAEFRNPFNSRNNLGYMHNHYTPEMQKYFNFGPLIIAVNMLHTTAQDRNNGSD